MANERSEWRRHALATSCVGPQDCGHARAAHVFHRDVEATIHVAELEDLHDVRMTEQRRKARLVEKHVDEFLIIGEVPQDTFDDQRLRISGWPTELSQED